MISNMITNNNGILDTIINKTNIHNTTNIHNKIKKTKKNIQHITK